MWSEVANSSFGSEIANKRYSSVEGDEQELEDEESVEYEGEDTEVGVPEADLPKFRTLVKNKKLEMKAQYGKGHMKATTKQECNTVKVPCPTFSQPFKTCDKRVCVNVPSVQWVWGWRKKWREFKQQGGLAQLKQQAKGLAPVVPVAPVVVAIPGATAISPGGLAKNQKKKTETTSNDKATTATDVVATPVVETKSKKPLYIGLGVLLLIGGIWAYKKYAK